MFLFSVTTQEHAAGAVQHGSEAAHATAQASAQHSEHIPWIVEKVNDIFGPAIFDIQKVIMPPIYKILSFAFGPKWPGDGLSYDTYRAEGLLPIPTQVVMFLLVVLFTVIVLAILRGKLSAENPSKRQLTFEVGVEGIRSLLGDLVGPAGAKHFPVIATFALLILFSNLMGMLPDMVAPTASFNMTLALAVTSFLYYNYIGIRENGIWGHLRHFCGPVLALAPLMFFIELVSNFARILSLSMRLFGNIYGEEQVSGAISVMVNWVVPALLMPLGLLTAFLQTFIFIVLSMVYLGEVSHSEDHGDEHNEGHGHAPAAAH